MPPRRLATRAARLTPTFRPSTPALLQEFWPRHVLQRQRALCPITTGLQTQLRQRFSNGLVYNLSYTYSRALDETSAINNIRGRTTSSWILTIRHWTTARPASIKCIVSWPAAPTRCPSAVESATPWGLAIGSSGTGSLAAIYTLSSGIPYSVYAFPYFTPDQTGSAFSGRIRANVTSSPTSGFTQTAAEWFNTNAFTSPIPARKGTKARASCGALISRIWI